MNKRNVVFILALLPTYYSVFAQQQQNQVNIEYIKNSNGIWDNKQKVKFTELLTIGQEAGSEKYLLADPADVTTDEELNIYICDTKDFCVKVYNKNGEFIRELGNKGQGPGEFIQPLDLTYIKQNKLCVVDDYSAHKKISIISTQGVFLHSFDINEMTEINIHDISASKDGKYIFVSRKMPALMFLDRLIEHIDYIIYRYDVNGQLINKFGTLEGAGLISSEKHYSNYTSVLCLNNGDVLVAYSYPYLLKYYSADGKHKKTIEREAGFISAPELKVSEFRDRKMKNFIEITSIKTILNLNDDKILVVISNLGKNASVKNLCEIYNLEGRLLSSAPWHNNERIVHSDKEGNLYSITTGRDEIPKVKKYALKIQDI